MSDTAQRVSDTESQIVHCRERDREKQREIPFRRKPLCARESERNLRFEIGCLGFQESNGRGSKESGIGIGIVGMRGLGGSVIEMILILVMRIETATVTVIIGLMIGKIVTATAIGITIVAEKGR